MLEFAFGDASKNEKPKWASCDTAAACVIYINITIIY